MGARRPGSCINISKLIFLVDCQSHSVILSWICKGIAPPNQCCILVALCDNNQSCLNSQQLCG